MWVAAPEMSVLLVPSPQWMVMSVPLRGIVMAWLAASVFQVVMNGSWSDCAWAKGNSSAAASPASRRAYMITRMVQMALRTIKA